MDRAVILFIIIVYLVTNNNCAKLCLAHFALTRMNTMAGRRKSPVS